MHKKKRRAVKFLPTLMKERSHLGPGSMKFLYQKRIRR